MRIKEILCYNSSFFYAARCFLLILEGLLMRMLHLIYFTNFQKRL